MNDKVTFSEKDKLTERQIREIKYYEEYVSLLNVADVSFDPINSLKSRPWNSYWYVYQLAKKYFNNDKNKLLDYGCGYGISSVRFAKIGYEVTGFDISEKSIEIAKKLAKKYCVEDKINFSIQIAEKLNYPPNYFDIAIGFDILHHVDIKSAILECYRVLKKEGIAIFREPVEVPILDYLRNTKLIKYLVPKDTNFTPGRHITQDEKKLLEKDIDLIRNAFDEIKIEKFTLISHLDLFFRKFYGEKSSPLEILDHIIFRIIPISRKFGGDCVFVLKKKLD